MKTISNKLRELEEKLKAEKYRREIEEIGKKKREEYKKKLDEYKKLKYRKIYGALNAAKNVGSKLKETLKNLNKKQKRDLKIKDNFYTKKQKQKKVSYNHWNKKWEENWLK